MTGGALAGEGVPEPLLTEGLAVRTPVLHHPVAEEEQPVTGLEGDRAERRRLIAAEPDRQLTPPGCLDNTSEQRSG